MQQQIRGLLFRGVRGAEEKEWPLLLHGAFPFAVRARQAPRFSCIRLTMLRMKLRGTNRVESTVSLF